MRSYTKLNFSYHNNQVDINDWTHQNIEDRLKELSGADKKVVWIKADLSLDPSSCLARLFWSLVAKHFDCLRDLYGINLETSKDVLTKIREHISTQHQDLTDVFNQATANFNKIAPNHIVATLDEQPQNRADRHKTPTPPPSLHTHPASPTQQRTPTPPAPSPSPQLIGKDPANIVPPRSPSPKPQSPKPWTEATNAWIQEQIAAGSDATTIMDLADIEHLRLTEAQITQLLAPARSPSPVLEMRQEEATDEWVTENLNTAEEPKDLFDHAEREKLTLTEDQRALILQRQDRRENFKDNILKLLKENVMKAFPDTEQKQKNGMTLQAVMINRFETAMGNLFVYVDSLDIPATKEGKVDTLCNNFKQEYNALADTENPIDDDHQVMRIVRETLETHFHIYQKPITPAQHAMPFGKDWRWVSDHIPGGFTFSSLSANNQSQFPINVAYWNLFHKDRLRDLQEKDTQGLANSAIQTLPTVDISKYVENMLMNQKFPKHVLALQDCSQKDLQKLNELFENTQYMVLPNNGYRQGLDHFPLFIIDQAIFEPADENGLFNYSFNVEDSKEKYQYVFTRLKMKMTGQVIGFVNVHAPFYTEQEKRNPQFRHNLLYDINILYNQNQNIPIFIMGNFNQTTIDMQTHFRNTFANTLLASGSGPSAVHQDRKPIDFDHAWLLPGTTNGQPHLKKGEDKSQKPGYFFPKDTQAFDDLSSAGKLLYGHNSERTTSDPIERV